MNTIANDSRVFFNARTFSSTLHKSLCRTSLLESPILNVWQTRFSSTAGHSSKKSYKFEKRFFAGLVITLPITILGTNFYLDLKQQKKLEDVKRVLKELDENEQKQDENYQKHFKEMKPVTEEELKMLRKNSFVITDEEKKRTAERAVYTIKQENNWNAKEGKWNK